MSIKISSKSVIYILCPANFATGGPEALHQLGEQLNQLGFNAQMSYLENDHGTLENPVHESYKKYNVPIAEKIINDQDNFLILPETYTCFLWDEEYKNLNKIVWWLSVTNYLISLEDHFSQYRHLKNFKFKHYFNKYPIPTIKRMKKTKKLYHLAHSYFSVDFLAKNKLEKIGQISDYMSESFRKGGDYSLQKENIIIYNPKKNDEFLEKIKEKNSQFTWLALENMTPEEVSENMKKAEVYIDFGYHPGKERMPRESCMMDCCLIIGKKGSAAFKEDMPIDEKYRFEFDEKNIPQISKIIDYCINQYDDASQDFKSYKNILLKEKETFIKDIQTVFLKR
ncbi:hypothetical protein OF897_17905 [Chryseobacterium formosus]|uniref:Glycosyltransferase family 1 protein n=1 Tax=Chryseobacterium formosus TaxID=1537363 RepID=A0ABT3XVU4_9FLAO|nr:hypothetical protein [Chryseobacterium formosus]MCX8525793.1 hypothetical protein [Chryseobacterium formosus]